jgi:outer membrane protein assembly factor BamE (lipoprotein component of BamABCDE complex)
MRKRLFALTLAVVIGMGAGCASDPAVLRIKEANFRQLRAGQSTKADVLAVLGKPELEMSFPRQGEEVWDYGYVDDATVMLAWVYFDTRGMYKHYVVQRDPRYYS